MNRRKVVVDDTSFKEFRRAKKGIPVQVIKAMEEDPDLLDIDLIVKFSLDSKKTPSNRKRKLITKELLLEYLDVNYNVDDF